MKILLRVYALLTACLMLLYKHMHHMSYVRSEHIYKIIPEKGKQIEISYRLWTCSSKLSRSQIYLVPESYQEYFL